MLFIKVIFSVALYNSWVQFAVKGHIVLIAVGISFGIACISVILIFVHSSCCHCRQQQQQQQQSEYYTTVVTSPKTALADCCSLQCKDCAQQQPRFSQSRNRSRRRYYHRKRHDCSKAGVASLLPIQLLSTTEEQNVLHTEPEQRVPMLSVQTAGCAGMERLGVPTRTTLNTPPDDRAQFSCRMRVDARQAREILAVRSETVIRSNNTNSNNNHHQQQQQQKQQKQQQQHSHLHHNQHYQRMTTPVNIKDNGSGGANQSPPRTAITTATSPSTQQHRANFNTGNGKGSSSSSNVARGGIEATTLKYGNTGSGSTSGNSSSRGGCSNAASGISSSCSSIDNHSIDHHQHYQHQLQQQQTLRCPHHVPLPDSEWASGHDRNMQLRADYQQSEIIRSYIKPPPNKTINDISKHGVYNLNHATTTAAAAIAHYLQQPASSSCQGHSQGHQHKSKPNVITKLFSRKSSPKSPTTLSASSSASSLASASASASASVSTSSSTSSLSSVSIASLPISTAAGLKTTACNYGIMPPQHQFQQNNVYAGLAPTAQLLTTIAVSPTTTPTALSMPIVMPMSLEQRIATPPLSVSVPITPISHQSTSIQINKQCQQQQQHQQQQLDSIVAECSTPTTSLLQLKSSSCNLQTNSSSSTPTNTAAHDASNIENVRSSCCICNRRNCNTNCASIISTSSSSSSSSASS